jgi:hypothetical protein
MAETDNIAKMANLISSEIFSEFGWSVTGPKNQNWDCITPEHQCRTHPSDVVFWYDDPYSNNRMYINCDLKSYAKGSITKTSIAGAVSSLSKTTQCAQLSADWRELYILDGHTPEIVSILFLYNHDGDYDRDFISILQEIDPQHYKLSADNKMFILGPGDICYLKTVTNDLQAMRGRNELPDRAKCSFYYPDLIRKKLLRERNLPATLEALTSQWLVIRAQSESETPVHDDFIIYYKRTEPSVDDFIYLIDYLFHYQLLQNSNKIFLKLTGNSRTAPSAFTRAKQRYIEERKGLDTLGNRLSKIEFSIVSTVFTQFNSCEIGMRI